MEIDYMTAQEAHLASLKNQKFDKKKYQNALSHFIKTKINNAIKNGEFTVGFLESEFNKAYFAPLSSLDYNKDIVSEAFEEVLNIFRKKGYKVKFDEYMSIVKSNDVNIWYDIFW